MLAATAAVAGIGKEDVTCGTYAEVTPNTSFLPLHLSPPLPPPPLLHSPLPPAQGERNQAVSEFRAGKAQVLVATDVAARGLDIRALPYVVNYDFPARIETYVHRVGRTGRLAACGHAYSFFTRNLVRARGVCMCG